ncbi:MAG: hypothetical protein JNN07_27685 [Verrucomicrobiales bacterium]|nr:hypothetical protein [Verrucomicrobiales bacterium]
MNQALWEMPVSSSALTRGPNFSILLKRECELSFYVEADDGDKKAGIVFDGVEAYKCTHMTARSVEMIHSAYDKLVRLEDSSWLTEVKANSAEYYAKRQLTPKELQHLMIRFDGGPCYEVICTGFNAIGDEG